MKTIITILILLMTLGVIRSEHAPFANFTTSNNSYIDYGKGQNLNCINNLSSGNKMTITMWVRWSNKGAAGVGNWANLFTLADSVTNGDNGVFWIQHNSNNTKFEFALHTNSREYIQSVTNPQNNHWYFLAMVYDGSLPDQNMKLYIDGNLEVTKNKTGNIRNFPAKSKLNMGRWAYSGNNYRHFNGSMDEVSIWNIAFTNAQITDMMNNPEMVTGAGYDTTGLLGYWNFDDLTANDLGICGNNGVVGGGSSLPVTISKFTAQQVNSQVDIIWSTSSEINNSYFLIERSDNGTDFEEKGDIKGAGNSNKVQNYYFTDSYPVNGISYYRLIQVDFDGKESRSDIISVNFRNSKDFSVSVYPNPSSGGNIKINSNSNSGEGFEVNIFDLSGREVYRNYVVAGSVEIPSGIFQNGIFVIKATNSVKTCSLKFIKD